MQSWLPLLAQAIFLNYIHFGYDYGIVILLHSLLWFIGDGINLFLYCRSYLRKEIFLKTFCQGFTTLFRAIAYAIVLPIREIVHFVIIILALSSRRLRWGKKEYKVKAGQGAVATATIDENEPSDKTLFQSQNKCGTKCCRTIYKMMGWDYPRPRGHSLDKLYE